MARTQEERDVEAATVAVYAALLEIHRRMMSKEFRCDDAMLAANLRKVADAIPARDPERERAEQEAQDAMDDGTVPDSVATPGFDPSDDEERREALDQKIRAVAALEASFAERRRHLEHVAVAWDVLVGS